MDKHTVKIQSKMMAERSLPKGEAFAHGKYDRGKYKESLLGRELEVGTHIVALYTVRRKDSYGPYYSLRCIVRSRN